MNNVIAHHIAGSKTGSGDVVWTDGGSTTTEIRVFGGLYLLLCSIFIDEDDLDADLFSAEWSLSELTPPRYEYRTEEHYHNHVAYSSPNPRDTAAGPRLVYQHPVQWWSFGLLPLASTLSLDVSHSCEVSVVAMRLANLQSLAIMEMNMQ